MKYSHNNEIEERYFALDIESLKQHDEGFKTAYDGGSGYELTIKLMDLFVIPSEIIIPSHTVGLSRRRS